MAKLLFNLIQSTNPCPSCEDASGASSMTLADWEGSAFGVPGSGGRYCEDNCHCLLIPDGTELPRLGPELLRGDKGSDIPKITDPFPLEIRLDELSIQYRAEIGNIPGRYLRMTVEQAITAMELELGIT